MRESDSPGMWRWSVDSQTEIPSIIPAPASSAPHPSSATGGAAARKAKGSAKVRR